MATFTLGVAQYDKLFLEYIKPGMNTMFISNSIVYDRFKTDTEIVLGKYGVMKLATASSKSARPSSTSNFPTARQGTYNEFVLYMKRGMYASLQFDGLAMACAKGDGAVLDIIASEVEGQAIYIANRLNRQTWGDGSGRLAELDAASANSTTVTIDSPLFGLDSNAYTEASNYLETGQYVDIYSTGDTLESEDNEISSITSDNDGTATLVMGTAVVASNGSWIFDHDTYATSEAGGTGVPMGLYGIISTSNATVGNTATTAFQNINRATAGNEWSQAQSFDMGASATAIKEKKILEMIQKCEKEGRIDVLITNGDIWRCWKEILTADKTMPNDPAYWGGTTGLSFYGGRTGKIPIIMDDDCPDQKIYAIDDDTIVIASPSKSGMDWVPGDNGILTRVQGKDEFAANLKWYYNMTCKRPRANGVMNNVKHLES